MAIYRFVRKTKVVLEMAPAYLETVKRFSVEQHGKLLFGNIGKHKGSSGSKVSLSES